jgi:hypothetical protein
MYFSRKHFKKIDYLKELEVNGKINLKYEDLKFVTMAQNKDRWWVLLNTSVSL